MSKINTPFCKLIHKMAYDRSFCDDSFIMSEKTLHFKSKSILPSHFLPDSWACPHPVLASCFLTDIQNISFLNGCGCRYGEDDFFYAVLFHRRHNVKPVSHNRNSLNVTAFFVAVVIDHTADSFVQLLRSKDLPDNGPAGASRSYDHCVDFAVPLSGFLPVVFRRRRNR